MCEIKLLDKLRDSNKYSDSIDLKQPIPLKRVYKTLNCIKLNQINVRIIIKQTCPMSTSVVMALPGHSPNYAMIKNLRKMHQFFHLK